MTKGWVLKQAISTQQEVSGWTNAIKKSANVEKIKFTNHKSNSASTPIKKKAS